MRIGLGQIQPVPGDMKENKNKIIDYIRKAHEKNCDLVVFPELAFVGYDLDEKDLKKVAETVEGEMVSSLREIGKELGIHIIAGYPERDGKDFNKIYNSCVFIDDKGRILENMRKFYLWKKENIRFERGDRLPVVETKLGKIGLLMCYDIEFPEPARIEALQGAEVIVVPSCWSRFGQRRWEIDLAANALFNLLYLCGVNVVDENCCGRSQVVGPDGMVLEEASSQEEELLVVDFDVDHIYTLREKIPYFKDLRKETLPKKRLDFFS